VPGSEWPGSYRLHPALLDGALQSLAVLGQSSGQLEIPFALDAMECAERLPYRCVAFGQLEEAGGTLRRYNLTLADEDGRVIALLMGIRVRPVAVPQTSSLSKSAEGAQLPEPRNPEELRPDRTANIESSRQRAVDYLIQKFAEVTKSPIAKIQADEPLENYGIDSMTVATFSQVLEGDLGGLSRTLLFEYPTLNALADYLLDEHSAALENIAGTQKLLVPQEEQVPRSRSEQRFWTDAASVAIDRVNANGLKALGIEQEIAIVGVFGRYPQAGDLDEFWENLINGKDCIEEVPPERWNYRDCYSPEPGKPGKTNNKWGGFIRDVDKFDPLFFNISPREAQVMDPQERLFLETVWKTLEDAGYSKSALNDRKIGVFVGVMYGHYQLFGVEERFKGNPISLSSSFATIANRISYYFNWHGPSLAIDTMCSSSLTSLHLACESLRRNECELAIAGGVNLTIHPEKDLLLTSGGFSALDGRCRTFGEGGTGYVPGEGVGALLLKPLARAVRDRDQIYAVIKVSALNHGGKTNGYTVPNSKSQADVVLETFRRSKIDPRTISYIEAHGTGTNLGDPIEITGLQQAFRKGIEDWSESAECSQVTGQFCAVGSVKSNIGHSESAAGVAGITKVLLQLKNKKLVPSLHAENTNPNIRFSETFFRVQRQTEDWRSLQIGERLLPRRAGISSFGAGGANAHIILEEYFSAETEDPIPETQPAMLFVLSAKDSERLKTLVSNLVLFLTKRIERDPAQNSASQKTSAGFLQNLIYTLQVGREPLEERIAFAVRDLERCVLSLKRWLEGLPIAGLQAGNAKQSSAKVDELRKANQLQSFVSSQLANRDLEQLSEVWVAGALVDWSVLYGEVKPYRISLPTYPFARQRYWVPQASPGLSEPIIGNGDDSRQLTSAGAQIEVKENDARSKVAGSDTRPLTEAMETRPEFSVMFFSDNSQVATGNKYEFVIETAKFADAHGFTGIWTPERHFHPFGGIYSSPATLMAALATITERIRLRAGSVVGPLQDPVRIAEAWSVVDNLSQGRVDVAFASGWNPNDFVLDPDAYPNLREVWLERIPQVQRLWRGESIERVNGKGETVRVRIYPEPQQKELPVWLTASRRIETFIDAGERGYHVLTMLQGSTLAQLAEKIRRYREARQRAGFDPAAGKITLMLHTFVHQDQDYARRLVRLPFLEYIRSSLDTHKTALPGGDLIKGEDLDKMVEFSYERYCREASLIGDPWGCLAMVDKCREIGVDEIACLLDFGADPASVLESLSYLEELRSLCRTKHPDEVVRDSDPVTLLSNGSKPALPGDDEPAAHFLTTDWLEERNDRTPIKSAESLLVIYSGNEVLRAPLQEVLAATRSYTIKLGAVTRRLNATDWEVDASSSAALDLLSEIARPDFICFVGAGECAGDESARANEAQQLGVIALTRVVRSIDALGWLARPLRIRIVTGGIHSVLGEPISPGFAGLSGLAGSLSKEYPHLDIAALDFDRAELADPIGVQQAARAISEELPQRASQKVAIRAGRRFRQRLSVTRLEQGNASHFRNQGVYLIIGGAGNTGTALSLYLARQYGARCIWIGRRLVDEKIEAQANRVRREGGDAIYLQGSAEDPGTLQAAISLARNKYGGLHGIVHSAFTFQDELLAKVDLRLVREILAAKAGSAVALLELTRELPLDFLLFLNSAQSFFNEGRRGVYAAACCFVDAYAAQIRQQVSFPIQVINWGFWSHSFSPALQATLREAGLGVIRPEDGMQAIETVVGTAIPQVAYLRANEQALLRMGIDPGETITYFGQECADEAHAILATQLFA
jgi:natural product biosynthesis luciferase-like monooxygenase protein